MGPYTHREVWRNGYFWAIENAQSRPVAFVEKNKLSLIEPNREIRSEIEAYCRENKLYEGELRQTYRYQRKDTEYIISKEGRYLQVIIHQQNEPPAIVAGQEYFVVDACKKIGVWPECKGKYSSPTFEEVMDEDEKKLIATVKEGIFTLSDKDADEEDVRLYCMTEGIFFL